MKTSARPDIRHWHALAVCREQAVPRVPLRIRHGGVEHACGSVARAHLPALARWPEALKVDDAGVLLAVPDAEREAFLGPLHEQLRDEGLIVAWRNETYPVLSLDDGQLLARIERAAARFWGALTFGAHCNGYVADAQGRPQAVWIARRSPHKATDPGALDNLIGGGVPHGQSPRETVIREGWEEAGLTPQQMQPIRPGRIAQLNRDIPEGAMLERISVYDLALPDGTVPRNQDGEVASIERLPLEQALQVAAGPEITVDAGIVMLDFALRHQLLAPGAHEALAAASADLWRGDAV